MKIGSTDVEMFRKEKDTVFCAFIVNIFAETNEYSLNMNKQQREMKGNRLKINRTAEREKFQEEEMSFRCIND